MVRTRRHTRVMAGAVGARSEEVSPSLLRKAVKTGEREMITQASPFASTSTSTLTPLSQSKPLPRALAFTAFDVRTSPQSMSPSSLFDEQVVVDFDNDGFGTEDIRGWLSETSRHLHSAEIPSSNSPTKGKGRLIVPGDVDSPLSASPTLSTKTQQRRTHTLSQVSPTWLSSGAAVQGSTDAAGGSSRRLSATSFKPATPTSSIKSRSSHMLARPQSAMKHRSANEYSSGKNVPTIVVSSGNLKRHLAARESDRIKRSLVFHDADDDDDQDAIVLGAQPVFPPSPFKAFKRNHSSPIRSLKRSLSRSTFDSGLSSSSPRDARTSESKTTRYSLIGKASLPQNSFYERTKTEEGSPTPIRRRLN